MAEICEYCRRPITEGIDLEALQDSDPAARAFHLACLLPFVEERLGHVPDGGWEELDLGPDLRRLLRILASKMDDELDARWLRELEARLCAAEDQARAAASDGRDSA